MKKFIEKIKNFFSAKDLDVYDNLPIEEQYYRLRIRSIKDAEKNSRFFLVVLVVLLIFLLVAIVVASFANTGESASAITASAQEEVASNEVLYTNYRIDMLHAPLHFFIPFNNYTSLNPGVSDYFTDNILYYQDYNGVSHASMFFVFQVIDDAGNIYYENVGRAGSLLNVAFTDDGVYTQNSNSLFGCTFSGSTASWQFANPTGRLMYPLLATNNSNNYPFSVYISSDKQINLNKLKVRSCALYDLLTYGFNEERIWGTYSFVNRIPQNHGELDIFNVSTTTSSSPLYPVKQSPDAQYNFAYNEGYSYGFDSGLTNGYERGYGEGSSVGYENGYNTGYDRGKIEGASNASDYSFLSLASAVFDAPIAVIVGSMQDTNGDGVDDTRVGGLLNFDLLGVNVASFLLAIFTVCMIIALVKIFMSK